MEEDGRECFEEIKMRTGVEEEKEEGGSKRWSRIG